MENKYISSWHKAINEAYKALQQKDIEQYQTAMNEASNAFNDLKREQDLTYKCTNFGMANHIFENALPKLFKQKSNAVKKFIKTIKEDKNLRTEFNFFKALEKYNENMNGKEYISEALSLVAENINPKTIKESNAKLYAILEDYSVRPDDFIPEDELKLYEACDYLFTHKKNLSNMIDYNNNIGTIVEFTEKNYNALNESKTNPLKMVEEFEKKYKTTLNEEEYSLVKEITDWRSEGAEQNKMKLFNKFKNECLSAVDKMLSEATDDEKESLMAIKEQINEKEYCKETVVKDLAKLLEIRDVLIS